MPIAHPILLRPGLRERLDRWQRLEPVESLLSRLLHTGQQE